MNAPEKLPNDDVAADALHSLLTLTREPFAASRKVDVRGNLPGVAVPMREIGSSPGTSNATQAVLPP